MGELTQLTDFFVGMGPSGVRTWMRNQVAIPDHRRLEVSPFSDEKRINVQFEILEKADAEIIHQYIVHSTTLAIG